MKENKNRNKTTENVTTAKALALLLAVISGSVAALINIALFYEIITIESSVLKTLISATLFVGLGYYWLTIFRNEYSQMLEWISLISFAVAIIIIKYDSTLRPTITFIAIGLAAKSAIPIVTRMTKKNDMPSKTETDNPGKH